MKQLWKFLCVLLYLVVILWVVDFRLLEIFDFKIMLSILVGSLLLTVSVKDKSDIKRVYLYQVTLTSILATSLLYLRTITVGSDNYLLPLQPMFYGLVYYVFFFHYS
jgi:predicted ferric reductase